MDKITPTPWRVRPYHEIDSSVTIEAESQINKPGFVCQISWWSNGDDRRPGKAEQIANAEYIVEAVNRHDELVTDLQKCDHAIYWALEALKNAPGHPSVKKAIDWLSTCV